MNSRKLFILLWLSHMYVDFCMGIWPIYKTWAQIDIALASLISGLAGFSGEVLQLFFGVLSDRGHRKKILLVSLFLASVILFVPFAAGPLPYFLLVFCLMLGSSSFHPSGMGVACRLISSKKKAALLFTAGGALGFAVSQLVFSATVQRFDGQIFPLILPLFLLVPFLFFQSFPEEENRSKRFVLKDFFAPLLHQRRPILLLYGAQVVNYGVLLTFMFMLPDILVEKGCHTWLCKGGGHLSLVLGSSIGMQVIGFFSERFGYKRLLTAVSFIGLGFIYTLIYLPDPSLITTILLLSLTGASIYITSPLIVAWGHQYAPEHPSTISGILMGFSWCLAHFFPAFTGFLTTFFSDYPVLHAIEIMTLLLFISKALVLLVPKKSPEVVYIK